MSENNVAYEVPLTTLLAFNLGPNKGSWLPEKEIGDVLDDLLCESDESFVFRGELQIDGRDYIIVNGNKKKH